MATYIIGFGEEKMIDFFNSFRQLLHYDPDQIQLLYVTPHRWTPYYEEVKNRKIVLTDQRKWDYKHQVLEINSFKPWMVILLVKLIEMIMQLRLKSLNRLFHTDEGIRNNMRWYTRIGRRVWLFELYQFFFITKLNKKQMSVNDFFC